MRAATLPIIFASLFSQATCLDNGLARTPQMGYNSWYDVLMGPSEAMVRETAQAMISNGLAAAGYKFINLDDGIVEVQRDANGDLVPDTKGFPNGFLEVSTWLHSQGFKFGVYTDRGPQTCGGRAGAFGHEAQDAQFYATNGIDYVKEDSCNAAQDHPTAYHEYSLMRDGLNATGRPIVFSLCGWETWYAPVGRALGNSWRIGPDDTNWAGILSDLDDIATLYPYAGPGGWNDPCLLLGYDSNGNPAVTDQQGRAQFSMWATVAAPLLLSQNVRNLTAMQLETYLNSEVIAVSQDIMGRAGQRLMGNPLSLQHTYNVAPRVKNGDGNIPVTSEPCLTATISTDGTTAPVSPQQWVPDTPAPGYLFNPATNMCINLDDCGTDLIAFSCVTTGGTCCGADCYDGMKWTFNSGDNTFRSFETPTQCATSYGSGSQISLDACNANPSQTWMYDNATQTIRTGTGSSQCATVGGNTTRSAVWGRPLADGAWALTFINAGLLPVDLTCGADCLAVTGWDADQIFMVRDLWAHAWLPNSTVSNGVNVTQLEADGGVAMFRITPVF